MEWNIWMSLFVGGINFLFLLTLYGYFRSLRHDKRQWNCGICPVCDNKWEFIEKDCVGGQVWRCSKCRKQIRLSGILSIIEYDTKKCKPIREKFRYYIDYNGKEV